jgi:hypothetical protein
MEMSNPKPMIPDTRKPTIPIIGIPFHKGGIPERTMREELTIRAAKTMAKTRRLLI